jgi:hypothetical protein
MVVGQLLRVLHTRLRSSGRVDYRRLMLPYVYVRVRDTVHTVLKRSCENQPLWPVGGWKAKGQRLITTNDPSGFPSGNKVHDEDRLWKMYNIARDGAHSALADFGESLECG